MTTGVPAPLVEMAERLLLLSRWSRQTGFTVVIARGSAAKQASLRAGDPGGSGLHGGKSWMPDEDSNLD